MKVRAHIIILVLTILGFSLALSALGGESEYKKRIYMRGGEDGRILWMVPPDEFLSAEAEASGHGFTAEKRNEFLEFLNRLPEGSQRCGAPPPEHCNFRLPGDPPPVDMETFRSTAANVAAANQTAVVGTVEHIMRTKDLDNWYVWRILFLRIEEVLKDESGELAVGELVTFGEPWGRMQIQGKEVCTYPPKDVLEIDESDRLIVVGSVDPWNDHHMTTVEGHYFGLDENESVMYSPRASYYVRDPLMTLQELRRQLGQ